MNPFNATPEEVANAEFIKQCESALKLHNARKLEYRNLERFYRTSGDPLLTELATFHARLMIDYTFVVNHYRDLLNPLPGFPVPDLQLYVAYSRLSHNHNEFARKHENLKKEAEGDAKEFHKTEELLHREMSNRYREFAKFWENKTRENRVKELEAEIAKRDKERYEKLFGQNPK